MAEPPEFMLDPSRLHWAGGEPRVKAVTTEDRFPEGWPSIDQARLFDIPYRTGGLTGLLDSIGEATGIRAGSFQATMENLEELSEERPLVIVVRDADRLLVDAGPAIIHLIADWEDFTHHASGISAMYLVLETGPRATVDSAFYPGGIVRWGFSPE
jgi:hypothetical protein